MQGCEVRANTLYEIDNIALIAQIKSQRKYDEG